MDESYAALIANYVQRLGERLRWNLELDRISPQSCGLLGGCGFIRTGGDLDRTEQNEYDPKHELHSVSFHLNEEYE